MIKGYRENLPITYLIVELLKKRNIVKDQELYSALKNLVKEISPSEFNKALMTLELRGIIEVDSIKKDMKVIRLIR
ncbi:MAG: hypothetical protein DRJ66_07855 [Thermoprotei archaeon]|nr:MAG: hypothetical protein DRJ66_07855 [Thermoprotei archaeon]RLF17021.1 MAG: hypothetical protein DRZ82_10215 [Thermoprotei archaeon]